MTLWAVIIGALFGWIAGDFEGLGLLAGGIVGLLAGKGIERGIRAEVARELEPLRAIVERLAAERLAAAGSPTTGATAAPAPLQAAPEQPVAPESTFVSEPAAGSLLSEMAPPAAGPWNFEPPPPMVPAESAEPVEPAEPARPGMVEVLVARARDWLLGGNTIVRLGLVVLFVGLAFLANYAAQAGLLPIELRLAAIAAVGVALLVAGFRSRLARPGFGLALQGGGVAVIYLTLFAAARLFAVAPLVAALALMVAVCALGCALALLQQSQALALTAFAGGFAAPLLVGQEGGSALALFGYFTVLNLAILFIAQRRSWRLLNLLGFFATFGIGALWGATGYRPADYWTAQAFLVVSVLIYVATAVLYTRRTPGPLGNVVDATLLFGPALAGFGLQAALVADRDYGAAFAALGFAAIYLGTVALTRRRPESLRLMHEAMIAIAVGFVTLAVPLALGARWTSAVWALEGAGAFFVGMRQARWLPRLFGLLLQAVAALLFLASFGMDPAAPPFVNADFVGGALIAGALLLTAWWLRQPLPHGGTRAARTFADAEALLGPALFLAGFGFAWAAFAGEGWRFARRPVDGGGSLISAQTARLVAMLAFAALAWTAQGMARRLGWPVAGWPARVTLPALAAGLLASLASGGHVLHHPDWMIWLAAVALHLHALYRADQDASSGASRSLLTAMHVGGVWLAVGFVADMLWLGVDRARLWDSSWAGVVFLVAVTAVLAALTLRAAPALRAGATPRRWPLDRHAAAYAWMAAAPVAALTFAGALATAFAASGRADPLPFVPLLNPVDLAVALAIAVLALWRRAVLAAEPPLPGASALAGPVGVAVLAGLAFVAVNTAWLRAAHHLLGVAWRPDALLASFAVQTGLAILWTLLALALMVAAHRRGLRTLWLTGAGLLGLTVAKLLLVDLGNAGGAERVVTFIAVGALMLLIGYLAPLPPRTTHAADAADGAR